MLTKHINKFAWFYLACFLFNFIWLIIDGNLLTQYQPFFFTNRLDVSLSLLLNFNLHKLILESKIYCVVLDTLYFLSNLLLVVAHLKNSRYLKIFCATTLLFNLTFALIISITEIYTIERLFPNFIVPIIFWSRNFNWFYYSMYCIRIVFVIIFFSAALWKVRTGAIFNTEQMSAILIHQHTPYLLNNSENFYGQFILFLINHKLFAFSFYLLGFFSELVFSMAFFTKKYDKFLLVLFIGFLIFNLLLMRIDYLNWLIFSVCLFFSQKKLQAITTQNNV